MGVMSRRVVPACSSLCYFCPSLRARSRQPVKRYKKLLSDIFQLSADGEPNDRKISKLCEYASRNPSRIPNITTYLDQRFYKDLRNEQLSFAKVVPCIYRKLLSSCKEQMPLLASSSLTIIEVLLGQRREDFQILGCLMLVDFLDNQVDVAYMVNVEEMIQKLCQFGQVMEDRSAGSNLRAAALQALASLVQYMGELSHISERFDDIVSVMMDNYDAIRKLFENGAGNQGRDLYVSESRKFLSTSINDSAKVALSSTLDMRRNPVYWARVCLHNIAKIAKEATTVRRVIDPLFRIFDERNHWSSDDGMAYSVLHEMQALMERSGQNSHLLLSIAIKHIDHKNVVKRPGTQIDIVKVISHLAKQTKVQVSVAIMTAISDTVRHLRSCMRLIIEASDDQAVDIRNTCSLYCALEECLVHLSDKVGDVGPIHDMLAVVLENLSPNAVIARATILSVYRTSQIAASIPNLSYDTKAFPEALFHQLLIAMMHADNRTRIGSHRVLSAIVSPSLRCPWSVASLPIPVNNDPRKICLLASSAFSSWTIKDELRSRSSMFEDLLKRDNECLQDKDEDSKSMHLTIQQVDFLLSSIWMQASLNDNIPANFEAMGHSYNLVLLSLQNHGKAMLVRCFQLAFSLRSMSLDNENSLQPSRRRPLYSLASSMLLFSAKAFGAPEIVSLVKSKVLENMVDPHLCLVEDSRLCATDPETSGNEIAYGSEVDDIAASNFLSSVDRDDEHMKEVVSCALESNLGSNSGKQDQITGTREQLHREFSPDESFPFSAAWYIDTPDLRSGNASKDSFGEDEGPSAVEDVESYFGESECQSEQRASVSLNCADVPSVNQLIQSVVETAGEEAAKRSVSLGPVPYDQMKSQCEALVAGKQRKMWILSSFKHPQEESDDRTTTEGSVLTEVHSTEAPWNTEGESSVTSKDHRMQRSDSASSGSSDHSLRLPPASPFDKFLKAARS